jgi:Ran GTPase-activating protein (RanGAP) involved in mRNA processing and transport
MPSWLEEICQRLNENDPNLTILELTHQRIDDRQASFLANSLRENTIVSAVTLSCFAIVDDGAFSLASVLGGSKSIKTLQLRDLRNSREVVTFFREIARNEKLEEFCLRHCQVCAKGAKLLQEMMQAHRKLKEVRFVDSQFIQCSLSQICTGIQQNSSILRLYLVNTEIDDGHGSRCLSVMLKVNNTLEELYLCENQLGNEGIEAIADGLVANQTLKKLDLRSNGIEVEGALAISSVLKKSTSLTTLSLGMNQVGDLGAAALAQGLLHGDCVLRELDLSDNGIGAGGAEALADMLVSNTRLQDLNLAFNSIESKGKTDNVLINQIIDLHFTRTNTSFRCRILFYH